MEPDIDTRGIINLGHVRFGVHALSELELEPIAHLTFVLRADGSLLTARVLWLCFDCLNLFGNRDSSPRRNLFV